ncbi:MAG: hypothetical protein AB7P69_02140 [Candidatus Binatia bacterium]
MHFYRCRVFVCLFLLILAACSNRPTKPLVLTEQVGELPVQFSSPNCSIPILNAPPTEPHEVIARIKTYGNPGTEPTAMRGMLHQEACAIGAQAVIVQPLKEGQFEDSISVQHLGYSTDRDYTSSADYAYQIIGLAIRYK